MKGICFVKQKRRVKDVETPLTVRTCAVAMKHTEISNLGGSCDWLFFDSVKIKETKLLTAL